MALLAAVEELEHVVVAEATVTTLAHAEEGELPTIPEALHGVHVEMQHFGDFGRRQQLSDLVRHHGWYVIPRIGALQRAVRTGQVRWMRLVVG